MAASDRDPSTAPAPAGWTACLSAEALVRRLDEEINRAGRQGTPLSCLLVTIGNLEELSREHGAELAERTLEYVQGALRRQLRAFDRIGRPSGNEQLVVLPGADGPRVGACRGERSARLRIAPVQGSALGAAYLAREPLALDRPRGEEAAWLHELGMEARAALLEPMTMEAQGGGLVIAIRSDRGFRDADREALAAFSSSVAQRLVAERSVEVERLRYGMEARERERTRWAREIHDESIQGMGALKLRLANARDVDDPGALREAVDVVLDGLGNEIDGLRHLITELRPAALDE